MIQIIRQTSPRIINICLISLGICMKARLIELTSFKLFSQARKTVRKYIMLANDLKHVVFITGNSIYFLLWAIVGWINIHSWSLAKKKLKVRTCFYHNQRSKSSDKRWTQKRSPWALTTNRKIHKMTMLYWVKFVHMWSPTTKPQD